MARESHRVDQIADLKFFNAQENLVALPVADYSTILRVIANERLGFKRASYPINKLIKVADVQG